MWQYTEHHEKVRLQTTCIIEPRCREQFQIAYPTAAYQKLLNNVPEIFVGSPQRLHRLVETLAPAVAEAFAAQRTPLPPWRKKLSMLTKWGLKGAALPATQPGRTRPAFARDLQVLQACSCHLINHNMTPPTDNCLNPRQINSGNLDAVDTTQVVLHLQPNVLGDFGSCREANELCCVLTQQYTSSAGDAGSQKPFRCISSVLKCGIAAVVQVSDVGAHHQAVWG